MRWAPPGGRDLPGLTPGPLHLPRATPIACSDPAGPGRPRAWSPPAAPPPLPRACSRTPASGPLCRSHPARSRWPDSQLIGANNVWLRATHTIATLFIAQDSDAGGRLEGEARSTRSRGVCAAGPVLHLWQLHLRKINDTQHFTNRRGRGFASSLPSCAFAVSDSERGPFVGSSLTGVVTTVTVPGGRERVLTSTLAPALARRAGPSPA